MKHPYARRKLYAQEVEHLRRMATYVADAGFSYSQNFLGDFCLAAERYEILCEDYERVVNELIECQNA